MNPTTSLAEIAVTHPAASRVFHRHRLDYCCGGRKPLAEACAAKGLDATAVLAEIAELERAQPGGADGGARWAERPLPEIVDFITTHYHRRLREELPELIAMAARVEHRHGDKASCPVGLHRHLAGVHEAVLDHIEKEEQILFPMIVAGAGERAGAPMHAMEVEHDDHRAALARNRALTDNITPPAEACTTWRALYLRLEQFEAELMEHIHLENNVLFPRALGR